MEHLQKIRLLEDRLHRLEVNDRNNYGICQKIKREMEILKKQYRSRTLEFSRKDKGIF